MRNSQVSHPPLKQVEQIAAQLGLSAGELNSLDWDIDFVDGPVVIFNGDSPVELLAKIKGLDNYAVRIPDSLVSHASWHSSLHSSSQSGKPEWLQRIVSN